MWQWMGTTTAGRFAQILAVASLVLSLFVAAKQYQLTSCLAAYNEAAARATQARSAVAEQDRRELDQMITSIATNRTLPPSESGRAIRAAFDRYLESRRLADEQRRANPLPPPPSQRC